MPAELGAATPDSADDALDTKGDSGQTSAMVALSEITIRLSFVHR
jgi:hypothetical protein